MRKNCVLSLFVVLGIASICLAQPLFHYVSHPDPSYNWEKISEKEAAGGGKIVTLKLTSQTWQNILWTHQLVIMQPPQLEQATTAVLVISGGKMGEREQGLMSLIAASANAPIVYLGDIPNQPLFDNLWEDALIAYTFQRALQTHDMTWPLLFPMTKAAIRAMDAVQEYTQQHWPRRVEKFVVTGASKRGWTTYFTGEADPQRVAGIAPIVYDNLNLPAQMAHQKASYGHYSSQIEDYTTLGLPDLLQTEIGRRFGEEVDPYTYCKKLTMPKLLIHGTNDPYWVVDSVKHYWDDLPAPKYLLNQPNIGHNVDPVRFINAEAAFYLYCAGRITFPELNWHFERTPQGLKLGIVSNPAPKRVLQWTTEAPTRDFRKSQWTSQEVAQAEGQWIAELARPQKGYAAMFAELVYEMAGRDVPLSTTIEVIGADAQ